MKKLVLVITVFLLLFSLCSCSDNFLKKGSMNDAVINLEAKSDIARSDIKSALKVVEDKFESWPGFIMHTISVSYVGKDVEYCNSLSDDVVYDECIVFESSFTTGSDDWSGFSKNMTYKGFNWYVAREKDGKWQLVTYGVC